MLKLVNDKILKSLFSSILIVACVSMAGAQAFKDVTKEAGLKHQFGVYEGMFGGGASVFDFNNDGWEDIFITGGTNDDVLYRNNGNGTFTNVYDKSGLEMTTHYVTQGVAAADINRDGWVDLFITTITSRDSVKVIPRAENLVFLNNGNSTFRNVTQEYGISDLISFSQGVSFGDFNADGFPDIYIGNYFLNYDGKLSVVNDATIVNANRTAEGYLLKNIEGKYFSDVYADYGLKHRGFGFGGVFTDFDNDNDLDIFINHDFGFKAEPNLLLKNQYPDREFEDITKAMKMDLKINAMGTAVGDYNNDGLLDYYVTNIRFNQFMINQGVGKPFLEKSRELGVGLISISWGTNFADFDHDTDLDLFVANGDLNPNNTPLVDYYFENANGTFVEKAVSVGLNDFGIGRGSVVFDMDNDGDQDLLVVNQKSIQNYPMESNTRLYRNDSTMGNWIKVALKGIKAETHGLGSRVEIVVGKIKMMREIDGGSSHLSQNSTIAHFGLGDATTVDSIVVTWLGGKKQILTHQKINQQLTIVETMEPESKSQSWTMIGLSSAGAVIAVGTLYIMRKRNRKSKIA